MEPLFLILFFSKCLLFFHPVSVSAGSSFKEFIYPNFTASNLHFIDNPNGAFLFSRNGTFEAAMFNPAGEDGRETGFRLCVIHVASNTIIWSANRDSPVTRSGEMKLAPQGLVITDEDGNSVWSTPVLQSPVYVLQLTDMGNLVLLDRFNVSLWESFGYPTDTIVIGQKLTPRTFLSAAVSDSDISTGDYRLLVSNSDMVLQWMNQTYWKLSMDTRAFVNANHEVEFMTVNRYGLFLVGLNRSKLIIRVVLPKSDFRIAKIDPSGKFIISSFSGKSMKEEFVGPVDFCRIPLVCGRIELCNNDQTSTNPICSCPDEFHPASRKFKGCVPINQSLSLPVSCNGSNKNSSSMNSSSVSYIGFGSGFSYFSIRFSEPLKFGLNLSVCQELCTGDCSCTGIFYQNSSGACYPVKDDFGSIATDQTGVNSLMGYVKVVIRTYSADSDDSHDSGRVKNTKRSNFPMAALVILPLSCFFLFFALGFLWWRRWEAMKRNKREMKFVQHNSFSSEDLESFHIPGLPEKFEVEELELATENFKTQIGSGGFGAVFKGILPDKSVVAVKKITNLGVRGKREFCTEIAIIGNIRHANLVKLRGFCAQGRQLLLVYEYMNRGSLEKTLFANAPVLEWQERFDIAVGMARGLAYLHGGCEHKIIHCDVKPENILLHDRFQVKISDFGLSKLLGQDESSLFTTMRGTRGYLAPEWLTNAAISEKADVYSYGMVLLELVSGRKNCSFRSHRSHSLDNNGQNQNHDRSSTPSSSSPTLGVVYFPLYALEMHEQGRYTDLADPRLEGRVTNEEVGNLVRIALCCVHEEPALRPTMAGVVGMLEGSAPIGQPRMESLNFLRFYGMRFAEDSMMAEQNGDSGNMLSRREDFSRRSSSGGDGGSRLSFSYVSSQQVSGPR